MKVEKNTSAFEALGEIEWILRMDVVMATSG
jgi:hypothetical protein